MASLFGGPDIPKVKKPDNEEAERAAALRRRDREKASGWRSTLLTQLTKKGGGA